MSTTLVVVAEGTHPHKQTSRERVLPDCLIRQIKDQVQAADGMEFMWSPCEGECQLAHLLAAGEVDFAILDSGDSDVAVFQVRGFIFHPGESQLFLMSFAQLLAIFADSLLQLGDLDVEHGILRGLHLDCIASDQVILACVLAGCDYMKIRGIGPKTARAMVQAKYDTDNTLWENAASIHDELPRALGCFLGQPVRVAVGKLNAISFREAPPAIRDQVWSGFWATWEEDRPYCRAGDRNCIRHVHRLRKDMCISEGYPNEGSPLPPGAPVPSLSCILSFCDKGTAMVDTQQPSKIISCLYVCA